MTWATHGIRRLISRFASTATMERLVDPILSDVEHECRKSVKAGRAWRARWIAVSGYAGLGRALALHGLHAGARAAIFEDGAGRTIAWSIAAFITLTLVLVLPPFLVNQRPLYADWGRLVVYVVPQAIPLSLPLAVAFGLVAAWPKRAMRRMMLRRTLVLGIAGMLVTLATMEWLMPAGNQAFRETIFHRLTDARVPAASIHLPRGLNERSLSELIVLTRRPSRNRLSGGAYGRTETAIAELSAVDPAFKPDHLRLNIQIRLALSLATGLLCFLAAAIASAVRGRNLGRTVFAGATVLYALTFFEITAIARVVSPVIAAWLPTVALALVSLVLLRARPVPSSGQ